MLMKEQRELHAVGRTGPCFCVRARCVKFFKFFDKKDECVFDREFHGDSKYGKICPSFFAKFTTNRPEVRAVLSKNHTINFVHEKLI